MFFVPIYPWPAYRPPSPEEIKAEQERRARAQIDELYRHLWAMDRYDSELRMQHHEHGGSTLRAVVDTRSIVCRTWDGQGMPPMAEPVTHTRVAWPNYVSCTPHVWRRYIERGLLVG